MDRYRSSLYRRICVQGPLAHVSAVGSAGWTRGAWTTRLATGSSGRLEGGLHDVVQRFAVYVTAQFVGGYAEGTRAELRAGAADVGRDEQVGAAPERMVFGQRFGVSDVNGGANLSGVQCVDERVSLYDGTSCSVDEQRALAHAVELAGADQATRLFSEREDQDDDIGTGQQDAEFANGVD